MFLGFGLLAATTFIGFQYGLRGILVGDLPGSVFAAWLQNATWPLNFLFLGWLMLVFPDGRLPSRRWRIVAWLLTVPSCLITFVTMVDTAPLELAGHHIANPFGSSIVRFLPPFPIVANVQFVAVAVCALAPILRFRRAGTVERHQLKWLAYVLAFILVTTLATFPLNFVSQTAVSVVGWAPLFGVALGIPVAIGVAVMRYRLYDIDRILSRTVSYALVTIFLGGLFALCVVVPSLLVGRRSVPDYVIAAATLVVAALFRPVRRRVQGAVDHRFNRQRYDAEHTVEAFAVRLREQIDIDALGAELVGVVERTMQPASATIWLRPRT